MTGRVSWKSPWGPIPVDLVFGRIAAIYLDRRSAPRGASRREHDAEDSLPRRSKSNGPITSATALQHLLNKVLRGTLSARDAVAAVDLSWATPFERSVLLALARVGRGTTVTYGELAVAARSPRAARAVGSALGRNRTPIVLPCHRIVAATGIGGYGGGAGRGWRPGGVDPLAFKRELLAREGVAA